MPLICNMLSIDQRKFLQYNAQTSEAPMLLEVVSAKGCLLTGVDGKTYMDFISGISVAHLGHGREEVVQAIKLQAEQHLHVMVYGEVVQNVQASLAERLVSELPPSLNSVYFTNSGTEAIEGAMKLAKRVTGKWGFVAQYQAYHGSTQGSLSLMSDSYYSSAYRPLLPEVRFIHQNDESSIQTLGNQVAAVVVELVQAERGCYLANASFIKKLRQYCDEHCALLIFDEIQTGMGKTGTLFAFEQFDVVPDILVLGKALGGGMPIGAFVANKKIMNTLSNNPVLGHITTFGGHPVSCAAALASLELTKKEWPHLKVLEKGEWLKNQLKHPLIKEVRGIGLLLAVELPTQQLCFELIQYCLENGLFTDWFLFAPQCLRIAPPLTIDYETLQLAVDIILKGLDAIQSH